MKKINKIRDLRGLKLDGFSIQEYTEVYMTNEDGRKTTSLGYYKDENVAKAFAQNQKDKHFCKTEKTLILTNGKIGVEVGELITIHDDEAEAVKIKNKALAKLTPEERNLLGL